jgi:hypothetical protein
MDFQQSLQVFVTCLRLLFIRLLEVLDESNRVLNLLESVVYMLSFLLGIPLLINLLTYSCEVVTKMSQPGHLVKLWC